MTDPLATPAPRHALRRERHELVRRLLTVRRVTRITPGMVRITLGGDDLAGFVSLGFDDHVKLFVPQPGQERPTLPVLGPDGPVAPAGEPAPVMRDYTPRRYDPAANELDVDFSLHEGGPATDWARQARPGQMLGVGGPRGSHVVPDDFDWYLLVGDETALPAIGRRLEELRPRARAIVVAEVDGAADEQRFASRADLDVTWLHRAAAAGGADRLLERALAAVRLPDGDGYVWVACESSVAKELRRVLVSRPGVRREWLKVSGYWKRGAVALHDTHED